MNRKRSRKPPATPKTTQMPAPAPEPTIDDMLDGIKIEDVDVKMENGGPFNPYADQEMIHREIGLATVEQIASDYINTDPPVKLVGDAEAVLAIAKVLDGRTATEVQRIVDTVLFLKGRVQDDQLEADMLPPGADIGIFGKD